MQNSSNGLLTWSILLLAAVPAWADDPPDVLVLQSGGTLVGRVTKEGDWYALRTLRGSGESRFHAAAVAKVCKGPLEAYTYLKAGITPDEPQDRCRLASFCLTHDLLTEAQAEIEAAVKLDPRCHEARTLFNQLQIKKNKSQKTEPTVPALPTSAVTPISPAKLDDWPLALTPAGFNDFNKRIQPLLMMGCGTGACHGVSEGKRAFYLTRGLYGTPPSPLVTRSNLERVLGAVNRDNLDESLLLTRGHTAHGNAKAPPLDPQTYALLRQWVFTMAGKQEVAALESVSPKVEPFAPSPPGAPAGFAAGSNSTVPSTTPSGVTGGSTTLPPIAGVTGAAARQLGMAEPPATTTSPTPALQSETPKGPPVIPSLSGKAAEQLGQKPPPPSTPPPPTVPPGPSTEAPKKSDPTDNPAFQQYAKRLGFVSPAPNVTREPPRQMKLANAGSFQTAYPPPIDIPDDVFFQLQQQAKARATDPSGMNAANAPFLNGGTPVSGPKKP